jgi:hypothetical protein
LDLALKLLRAVDDLQEEVFHGPGERQVAIATGKEDHGGQGVGVGVRKVYQLSNAAVLDVLAVVDKGTHHVCKDGEAHG